MAGFDQLGLNERLVANAEAAGFDEPPQAARTNANEQSTRFMILFRDYARRLVGDHYWESDGRASAVHVP